MSGDSGHLEDLKKIFGDGQTTHNIDTSDCLKTVRDKLYYMLRSPLKEEYYSECFKWVANLCLTIGDLSWLSSNQQWTTEETKIFSCITRLSMNELHILLPLIQRHLTQGDKSDMEDGKIMTRSANSSDYDALGNHFVVLESTIKSLIRGQDDEGEGRKHLADIMPNDELRCILTHLKDVMLEISDYLEMVHRYWSRLSTDPNSEISSAARGALRIMSVWLSEEPDGFGTQCKRFLVDLIIKNLLLPGELSQHDILVLALHSVCMQNEDSLNEMKQHHDHKQALQNYLDHVQQDKQKVMNCDKQNERRRIEKDYKLRCGLIKDLLTH